MMVLLHLLEFVFSPGSLLVHTVAGGIWYTLHRGEGVPIRHLIVPLICSELLTYLLWLVIPNNLATIGALWALFVLYQTISGQKVSLHENAVFLADEETAIILEKALTGVKFQTGDDGRLALRTSYYYVTYDSVGQFAIDLSDVTRVEPGCDWAGRKAIREENFQPLQCFHMILGDGTSVTVITDSTTTRQHWIEAVHGLLGDKLTEHQARWMDKILHEAELDKGEGKCVTVETALLILERIHRPLDKVYAYELCQKFASKSTTKKDDVRLGKSNFIAFFDFAIKRPEIREIFERELKNVTGEKVMQPFKLREFMMTKQKEEVTTDECRLWIQKHEEIYAPLYRLTDVGFTSFLLSKDQSIFRRDHYTSIYQDMNQPLSHYFIATSHNTYLTEGQLRGRSSMDAYVTAFTRGCKCVELDCWDGANNEPVITHGHTLTTKIYFRDVIKVVKEYGFCVSDLPVILSFEIHCSVDQQKVMANHLRNILGDILYTAAVPEAETVLPSPSDLRGHVIIKAKKRKIMTDDESSDEDESDSEEISDEVIAQLHAQDNDANGNDVGIGSEGGDNRVDQITIDSTGTGFDVTSISNNRTTQNGMSGNTVNGHHSGVNTDRRRSSQANINLELAQKDDGGEDGFLHKVKNPVSTLNRMADILKQKRPSLPGGKKSKPIKVPKVAQELSDLVVYCQAVHFKGFQHSKEYGRHCEMSSFSEKKATNLCQTEDRLSFVEYNQRQLSRIYPSGKRVDSSNYDPNIFWNVGCQLVALNYQTAGYPMQLNQGLFQDNGGSGYVLKPDFMRSDNTTFDPAGPFYDNKCSFLSIRIISGMQLPYGKEKHVRSDRTLHVQVRVSGVKADLQKERTKSIKNNGYNPVWNEVLGLKVHVPELALLQFQVHEDSNTFLGQYTLPMLCMQQGYRRVPLLSKDSKPIANACLFIHVDERKTGDRGH